MPHSYHPISLLSHLEKGLEEIVDHHLMHFLETQKIISPYQFGFWVGRYIVAACHQLTKDGYGVFWH